MKIILNHVTHSASLLDKIAATGLPVIVGPIYEQPKEAERYDAVFRMPAELAKRGMKIAFASYDAHKARNLPYAAGYAVGFGLPPDEALKALTLNPAQMWGVDKDLGSLEVGQNGQRGGGQRRSAGREDRREARLYSRPGNSAGKQTDGITRPILEIATDKRSRCRVAFGSFLFGYKEIF